MTIGDPLGYYAQLGVNAGASTTEIKAAYRRLAKDYHPDRNRSAEAQQLFQTINTAYRILGNSRRRVLYDNQAAITPAVERATTAAAYDPAAPKLDPVCCTRCGRTTAQPRVATFRQVIGLGIITLRKPVEGIFCSTCARRVALRASLISAVAGWWALPMGPIHTIVAILLNARGGTRDTEHEETLLWHNARAFYALGDFSLAYALAYRVRGAQDSTIAISALRLVYDLRAFGLPRQLPVVKRPWHPTPVVILAHVALLCAVPLLVLALFYQHELMALWTQQPAAPLLPTPAVTHRSATVGALTAPDWI